jgi:quercetin dioxygenase-like cupin family protein
MDYGQAIIAGALRSADLRPSQLAIYDRPIGVRLLYRDPESEAEHYLIRYPADLTARPHRHGAAQTIVVLDGSLIVNGTVIGPGSYCHFPAGEAMHHAPAGGETCLFVTIFHGPLDVQLLDD